MAVAGSIEPRKINKKISTVTGGGVLTRPSKVILLAMHESDGR